MTNHLTLTVLEPVTYTRDLAPYAEQLPLDLIASVEINDKADEEWEGTITFTDGNFLTTYKGNGWGQDDFCGPDGTSIEFDYSETELYPDWTYEMLYDGIAQIAREAL